MVKKILIVEDDPVQDIVETLLRTQDYSIQVCTDGDKALEAMKVFKPDLLLLDVMLPGMDGYTLVQKIIADQDFKELRIVVLSALSPAEVMFRTQPQVVEFIHKPFPTAVLLEAVRKALNTKL